MKLCVVCKKCKIEEMPLGLRGQIRQNEIYCNNRSIENRFPSFSSQEAFLEWNKYANQCPHYEASC